MTLESFPLNGFVYLVRGALAVMCHRAHFSEPSARKRISRFSDFLLRTCKICATAFMLLFVLSVASKAQGFPPRWTALGDHFFCVGRFN